MGWNLEILDLFSSIVLYDYYTCDFVSWDYSTKIKEKVKDISCINNLFPMLFSVLWFVYGGQPWEGSVCDIIQLVVQALLMSRTIEPYCLVLISLLINSKK
jgi:hypothetical protein